MTPRFDDEVLLLHPVSGSADAATIEQHLAGTPGTFRDPHDPSTWILAGHPQFVDELRRKRVENPTRYLPDPRVIVSPEYVTVVPGVSGRGRKFVHWLLSQGPCELTVRGQAIGRVASPSDIYAEEAWDDPDAWFDPTETPPRTGSVITVMRHHLKLREHIAVHDSGVVSYAQWLPDETPEKTFLRMSPELLSRWLEIVKRLPLEADAPGPGDTYIDPVLVELDIPTDIMAVTKMDAARPTESCQEFFSLVNEWAAALRNDRAAMPPGLRPFP